MNAPGGSFVQNNPIIIFFKLKKNQTHGISTHNMSDQNINLKRETIDSFCSTVHQFIEQCGNVWPECDGVRELKLLFDMSIVNGLTPEAIEKSKLKLITAWHENVKDLYSLVAAKDPTFITEHGERIEMLKDCRIRDKWLDTTIDETTRENIWLYFAEMCKYSQMHFGLFQNIPSNAMSRIESTAMNLAEKLQNGSMTMNDINFNDIGQSVISGLSEEELSEFTNSLMGDMGTLQNLAQSMMGEMGNMPSGAGANPMNAMFMANMMGSMQGGGANVSDIMSMMGGGMPNQGNNNQQ